MSGFEVVGVVLGVLPLLVSAAENYEEVLKPFRRFKKYAPELELYQQQLKTQKMIFLNQCQLLLTSLTSRESAKAMLREKDHPSWSDEVLKQKFADQLGNSREACEATVKLIARKLNQDFRTLAKQTSKLDRQHRNETLPQASVVYPSKKIEESCLVRRASAQLYDAMGRACRHHMEHRAHFQLLPQNIESNDADSPYVRFNIAFTHGVNEASATLEPVWIAVDSYLNDSMFRETDTTTTHLDEPMNLSSTLAHNLDSETLQPRKKAKVLKTVRFTKHCSGSQIQALQDDSSKCRLTGTNYQSLTSLSMPSTKITYSHPSLPDFCIQHDFCQQLLSNYTYPESLASIIASMARKPEIEQLLEYERLRLAARLASAVLRFHTTPLLRDFWRSEDVIFFGKDGEDNATISSPHLNVQVGSSISQRLVTQDEYGQANITEHLIRNPYLFSLGVTLIELAFQAPLRSLYSSGDLIDGQHTTLSDFFVASRLSKTISSSLGLAYGKVVRKCLGCDFGQGTSDLNDKKLQTVFYQDVVCELERLERGFAMLQLGG